jgi:hypothetical protein
MSMCHELKGWNKSRNILHALLLKCDWKHDRQ